MKPFKLQCMHGTADDRALAGNTALVTLAAAPQLGPASAGGTQIYVVASGPVWQVAAFSAAGAPIQFCGHGALAAARVVFDQFPAGPARREFASATQTWTAEMGATTAEGDATVQLQFARPAIARCAVPDFAAACLGVTPVAAATAGGPAGYMLLEGLDAAAVADAEPDAAAICAATRRALILTAATQNGFVLRYFAPQYGELEDAATGSAAVQLAAYWAHAGAVQAAMVTQLSAAGGRMRLSCNTATVELSARVAYL